MSPCQVFPGLLFMHLIFFNISYSSHKKMEHLDAFYNRELMCSGMMEMVSQLFSPRSNSELTASSSVCVCVCVFNIYIYLFTWLGLSCCTQDLWSSLQPVGSSSSTRDGSQPPALGMQSLSHWTTKKSPLLIFSFFLSALSVIFCCPYELKLLFTRLEASWGQESHLFTSAYSMPSTGNYPPPHHPTPAFNIYEWGFRKPSKMMRKDSSESHPPWLFLISDYFYYDM